MSWLDEVVEDAVGDGKPLTGREVLQKILAAVAGPHTREILPNKKGKVTFYAPDGKTPRVVALVDLESGSAELL